MWQEEQPLPAKTRAPCAGSPGIAAAADWPSERTKATSALTSTSVRNAPAGISGGMPVSISSHSAASLGARGDASPSQIGAAAAAGIQAVAHRAVALKGLPALFDLLLVRGSRCLSCIRFEGIARALRQTRREQQ